MVWRESLLVQSMRRKEEFKIEVYRVPRMLYEKQKELRLNLTEFLPCLTKQKTFKIEVDHTITFLSLQNLQLQCT